VRTIALPKKYKNKNTNYLQSFVCVNDCIPRRNNKISSNEDNEDNIRYIADPVTLNDHSNSLRQRSHPYEWHNTAPVPKPPPDHPIDDDFPVTRI
jgi:hypothetical protein